MLDQSVLAGAQPRGHQVHYFPAMLYVIFTMQLHISLIGESGQFTAA